MRKPLVTAGIPVVEDISAETADAAPAAECAADGFLKFISQEWMSHIVLALARHGSLRFGGLRRHLPPGVSARVLSARLKALQAAGYVDRHDLSGRVLHVEYSLTAAGHAVDAALARSEQLLAGGRVSLGPSGRAPS
ncbi:helix-turn-helix domain-containing protein [Bosea sp. (in: a-proteobacteria)]|uniref:winged helix-turn-helix transcriptional regulator n=1 Tax=Bosea sp. (in: a-proteobacteria) TaxID=1871050 RepID=UPI000956FF47|nr:helix-turn-helix domain-containing protein [Bosea sp. (in: a-proteobacteria)]TAJ33381.1 MAG: transcriptional regulator [Bosea sp. (in: a-proteobacteria)]SIP96758.1 transcriptional regulator, HxlR family [Bosea sp. TND4EK4]